MPDLSTRVSPFSEGSSHHPQSVRIVELESSGKKAGIFPQVAAILRGMPWWPPPLYLIMLVSLTVLLASLSVYLLRAGPGVARVTLAVQSVGAVGTLVLVFTAHIAVGPVEESPLHALEFELAEDENAGGLLWRKLYLRGGSSLDPWCRSFGLPFLGALWLVVIMLLVAETRSIGEVASGEGSVGASYRGLLVLLEIVGAVMLFALGGVVMFI